MDCFASLAMTTLKLLIVVQRTGAFANSSEVTF
jgi:hypothetical protein